MDFLLKAIIVLVLSLVVSVIIFIANLFTWTKSYSLYRGGAIIFDLDSLNSDNIKIEFEKDIGSIISKKYVILDVVDKTKMEQILKK